ncbi:putative chitinase 2 isoform X2 [Amblyomma americanum]
MYESGGFMDVSSKNLVDVLNEILGPMPHLVGKLVPTVSTVGKKYVFADAAKVEVGDLVDLSVPPQNVPLATICQEKAAWTFKLENKTKCYSAFNNKKEWIGFESPTSVVLKTELVKKKKLLGIAVLNIEQDDRSACTEDSWPYLLGAVQQALR